VYLNGSVRGQSRDAITFTRFHDYAAQGKLLQQLASTYPKLMKVQSYGKSYQGRDLWIVSVTNQGTGPIEEKPAFWIDAGYDGGETFPIEIALYLLNHLLTNYGTDETVTEILDTRGFYILPNGNPDASEQLHQKPAPGPKAGPFMGVSRNAWLKPVDDDFDELIDEDPPEDLDADGLILQMRLRDPAGHYVTDERDNRLLRLRKPWEKGEWRLIPYEGIDNDGDGRFNEDWYGGYDTNRNAPANWDPARIMEEVAPYPVYMPEVKHFVDALLARPNVFAQLDLHTSGVFPGGTLWEVPASQPVEDFPAYDMKTLFPMLGREWQRELRKAPHSRATAMPVYVGYGQRGRTLSGVMSDYGYIVLGLLAWVQEHDVNAPDYDDDGERSELDRIRWNDTELTEKIWVDWKRFKHPQLGDIDIGGWVRNNDDHGYAPAELIEWHAKRSLPWYLVVARMAPLVRVLDATATPLGDGLFMVSATVRNVGVLDTNVTEQGLRVRVNPPTPVTARLVGSEVEIVTGDPLVTLGHLHGNQPGTGQFLSGNERTGEAKTVRWVVRSKKAGAQVTIDAGSNRAGRHRASIVLSGSMKE
jgi:hypothetical protein